jgi:uncharacterized membrane protein YkvI
MVFIAAIISLIIAIIIFVIGIRVLKGLDVLKENFDIPIGEAIGIIIVITVIVMMLVFQYDPDNYPDVVNIKMYRK